MVQAKSIMDILSSFISGMLRSTNYEELELYSDYDAYHGEKVFGDNLERAHLVEDWILPESRVLDVGCGDGAIASYLKTRLDLEVLAYDISDVAVSKAIERGIIAEVKDIDADPSFPSSVDYILFIEVLEHLRRPHVVLKAAAQAARKGVIVTLPNSGFLPYRVQVLRGRFINQSFMHFHFWTHKDFESFCRFLNLVILEFRPFSSNSGIRSGMLRAFPNLLSCQIAYLLTKKGAQE